MGLPYQIVLFLALSLLLSFLPFGRGILFPIQIFTTWLHECWHAGAAAALGGSSIRMTLSMDGGGLTQYKIPAGKLRQGVIASAGYLGASASGCIIFYLTLKADKAPLFLSAGTLALTLSILIALSMLFWIRNSFGFFSAMALAFVLAALHYYPPINRYAQSVLLFLGIQTAFNGLFDIRTLFSLGNSQKTLSDAHKMQKLFYLPYWCWALTWLGMSFFMMYWTARQAMVLNWKF